MSASAIKRLGSDRLDLTLSEVAFHPVWSSGLGIWDMNTALQPCHVLINEDEAQAVTQQAFDLDTEIIVVNDAHERHVRELSCAIANMGVCKLDMDKFHIQSYVDGLHCLLQQFSAAEPGSAFAITSPDQQSDVILTIYIIGSVKKSRPISHFVLKMDASSGLDETPRKFQASCCVMDQGKATATVLTSQLLLLSMLNSESCDVSRSFKVWILKTLASRTEAGIFQIEFNRVAGEGVLTKDYAKATKKQPTSSKQRSGGLLGLLQRHVHEQNKVASKGGSRGRGSSRRGKGGKGEGRGAGAAGKPTVQKHTLKKVAEKLRLSRLRQGLCVTPASNTGNGGKKQSSRQGGTGSVGKVNVSDTDNDGDKDKDQGCDGGSAGNAPEDYIDDTVLSRQMQDEFDKASKIANQIERERLQTPEMDPKPEDNQKKTFFAACTGVSGFGLAASGRSKCSSCQQTIAKGTTRFEYSAHMLRPPKWLHSKPDCISKIAPGDVQTSLSYLRKVLKEPAGFHDTMTVPDIEAAIAALEDLDVGQ